MGFHTDGITSWNTISLQPDIQFHSANWFLWILIRFLLYVGIKRYRDRFFLYVDYVFVFRERIVPHFPTCELSLSFSHMWYVNHVAIIQIVSLLFYLKFNFNFYQLAYTRSLNSIFFISNMLSTFARLRLRMDRLLGLMTGFWQYFQLRVEKVIVWPNDWLISEELPMWFWCLVIPCNILNSVKPIALRAYWTAYPGGPAACSSSVP